MESWGKTIVIRSSPCGKIRLANTVHVVAAAKNRNPPRDIIRTTESAHVSQNEPVVDAIHDVPVANNQNPPRDIIRTTDSAHADQIKPIDDAVHVIPTVNNQNAANRREMEIEVRRGSRNRKPLQRTNYSISICVLCKKRFESTEFPSVDGEMICFKCFVQQQN